MIKPTALPSCGLHDTTIPPVLIVDDEEGTLRGVALMLRREGMEPIRTAPDGRQALAILQESGASVVLLDLNMPQLTGQQTLKVILEQYGEIPVLIMTAVHDVDCAVDCMKQGATDYLLKPLEEGRLLAAVRKAREMFTLRRELGQLKGYLLGEALRCPSAFAHIITRHPRMIAIFKYLEAASQTREALLITGETGTGKELFAKAFHNLKSGTGPFVAVNVAGLDDHIFADTLFGHRKGAFTGAEQSREGMVARAAGGVLFLDEIGDLAETSQIKLLRLLQERKYEPLGSDISRNADITVVAATNRELRQQARDGRFRQDLYYRLATHTIHLPPLRERKEDIPLLLNQFLAEAAQAIGRPEPTVPEEALALLGSYPFPGNVRELRAMVFDAVARHDKGVMPLRLFREAMGETLPTTAASQPEPIRLSWPETQASPTLKEAEEFLIAHALRQAEGNQGVAAAMLGLTRQALNQRLQRKIAKE